MKDTKEKDYSALSNAQFADLRLWELIGDHSDNAETMKGVYRAVIRKEKDHEPI